MSSKDRYQKWHVKKKKKESMKDELGQKMMRKFAGLKAKTYSY